MLSYKEKDATVDFCIASVCSLSACDVPSVYLILKKLYLPFFALCDLYSCLLCFILTVSLSSLEIVLCCLSFGYEYSRGSKQSS